MDGCNNACGKPFRVLIGANGQRHPGLRALVIMPVNLRTLIDAQLIVPDVPDDADNLRPRSRARKFESLADCALIRPDEASESLVDDAYLLAVRRIRFFEKPALNQRYS